MRSSLILGIVIVITACVATDVGDFADVEQQVGGNCTSWMCGMNSPNIDSFGFHELNLDHIANLEGFAFDKLTQSGNTYELRSITA